MSMVGAGLLLEACGTPLPLLKTSPKNQLLTVPVDKFTGDHTLLVVRSSSLENDILLVKKKDSYKALYLKCTHENFGLTPTSKKIVCPAHGSQFDLEGNVIKEPALRPLKEFITELNQNNIIIHLT